MLKLTEAATYCGLPTKYFKTDCPVSPLELRPGLQVYDKRDLDQWIDGKKQGSALSDRESILGALG